MLLLEQATVANFFNKSNFQTKQKTKETIEYTLKRLNFIDKKWNADLSSDDNFKFIREENKVKESFEIKRDDIEKNLFERLNGFSSIIQEFFLSPSKLSFKDEELEILTPRDLVNLSFELSKKGITVQRYKGLGEMNPDQLWDTTLDPSFRSILKVKVDDAQRADEIFSELMGEDVDKRKTFIQSNAKKVSNLDV